MSKVIEVSTIWGKINNKESLFYPTGFPVKIGAFIDVVTGENISETALAIPVRCIDRKDIANFGDTANKEVDKTGYISMATYKNNEDLQKFLLDSLIDLFIIYYYSLMANIEETAKLVRNMAFLLDNVIEKAIKSQNYKESEEYNQTKAALAGIDLSLFAFQVSSFYISLIKVYEAAFMGMLDLEEVNFEEVSKNLNIPQDTSKVS